jgi:predicted nucleotide-binding protein (sugar kinase/HSP70/actin superfamily)
VTRPFRRSSAAAIARRKTLRVGIPRVLNVYSTAPFFRAYFEVLGLGRSNIVFSDATSEEMWVEGGKYGSIDPCFPSKVAQAHVHNLLFHHHEPERKRQLNYIFFPILTHVNNFVKDTQDNASCPIVAGTPDVMKAAFTKEVDFFAQRGIEYLAPALSFMEPVLLVHRMFQTFGERLQITEDENDHACREVW